jgi:hypothetical protein
MDLEEIEIKEQILEFLEICYDIYQYISSVDCSMLDGESRNIFETFDDLFKINNVSMEIEHDNIEDGNFMAKMLYDHLLYHYATLQFIDMNSHRIDKNRFHDVDEQGSLYDIYMTVGDFIDSGRL